MSQDRKINATCLSFKWKKRELQNNLTFPPSLFRNLDKNKCMDKTPEDSHQISNSAYLWEKGLRECEEARETVTIYLRPSHGIWILWACFPLVLLKERRKLINKQELLRESLSSKLPVREGGFRSALQYRASSMARVTRLKHKSVGPEQKCCWSGMP